MECISLGQLSAFARRVLRGVAPQQRAFVITLVGELGAGKTTFMQAFARELGIEEVVQSPTYVLMRSYDISYKTFTRLLHIDAYRLEKPEEFDALKPETFLSDPHALVCIEWPERVGENIHSDMQLHFSHAGRTDAREVSIE